MSDSSGEQLFQAAWLNCLLSASLKQEEAFIRIPTAYAPEPPSFYVSRSLVQPEPPANDEVDGRVLVTLLYRSNGRSVIEVSGEPLSFGPRLEVPSDQLA